jgi:hypothetical protein
MIKGRKFNLGGALPSKLACQLGGLFYFKGIEPREMANVPLSHRHIDRERSLLYVVFVHHI